MLTVQDINDLIKELEEVFEDEPEDDAEAGFDAGVSHAIAVIKGYKTAKIMKQAWSPTKGDLEDLANHCQKKYEERTNESN